MMICLLLPLQDALHHHHLLMTIFIPLHLHFVLMVHPGEEEEEEERGEVAAKGEVGVMP